MARNAPSWEGGELTAVLSSGARCGRVTCNHVHLLVEGEDRAELSAWMQSVAREQVLREPCWRESLVMGSADFVGRMQPLILSRQETEMVEVVNGIGALRESEVPYGKETGLKSAP